MRRNWRAGAVVMSAAVVVAAVVVTPRLGAEAVPEAQAGTALVDPAVLSGMQYRHLSVFSGGGRSTAVVGVPSNPNLFYAGYTGGGVWQTTNAGGSYLGVKHRQSSDWFRWTQATSFGTS